MADKKDIGLTDRDKLVIRELSGDLGDGDRPFRDLGLRIGLTEDEVLETVQGLHDKGKLRRFGATLRHHVSGFTANAMVAWKIDDDEIDEIGKIMATYQEVTHCYHRPSVPGWPYTLYTMVHGTSEEACHEQARRMSEKSGITEYALLFSDKELKKTSMRYFE